MGRQDSTSAIAVLPNERVARARVVLALEYALLFFTLPTLWVLDVFRPPLILMLCVLALGCLGYLLRKRDFDRSLLWNASAVPRRMGWVLGIFIVSAAIMTAAVYFAMPHRFLELPRRRPELWLIIMVFYPLFSVYPQEIIFRVFLFERYRPLFQHRWPLIVGSAAAFAYGHIIFGSPVSVILTLLGGLLFAKTYADSRSTLLVAIEHALYGCFIFTVGLGYYFYTGAAH